MSTNPFEIQIPDEHKMVVDARVWSVKLDDSGSLMHILKWLLENRPRSRDVFGEYETPQGTDAGAAIIDILSHLCECEKAIDKIRDAIAEV